MEAWKLKRKESLAAAVAADAVSNGSPQYRIVSGFSQYRIGDDGSLWRFSWDRNEHGRWKQIKPTPMKGHGYLRVYLGNNGKRQRTVFVHVLVLEAFVGPCPKGKETCHWDDDPSNNRLGNIRWGTRLENAADRIRRGRVPMGSNHARTKFVDGDIYRIRKLHKEGGRVTDLAREYAVTTGCITSILQRWTWKHI